MNIDPIIRPKAAFPALGKSRSAAYADIAAGLLPPPFKLSSRAVGWFASELATVAVAIAGGATPEEMRSLAAEIVQQRRQRHQRACCA